ncbi:MAG: ABC transporter ATP-binding protein [Candidatus Pacebacteria bacterium]|jgi:ABC-type polysaccharide/polyol phosphate transport system ATPase subunit|nr:ABC transporter ATP-binding protein [Candidatus Paceibacterota bacterium]MBT4004753.1 ABC transporter ATP-binding protein [Candidatus Paceibacterota bacterium]MBT6899256.1 ABC transporter ATP-binding protein [Candidatus Paceibacterota bacterium]MBT7184156.1 ABC transporter ATP-binding protein [Candidatus Paceibacterota bacterium]MBT7310012.1 ABC transporter ATP-binding protein [Candidatus Paceibacterota bacterium]
MTNFKEEFSKKNRLLSSEVVIDLQNIGKKYVIHHEKPTLAEDVSRAVSFRPQETYWALRSVNLKIYKGEKIGFIGPNGSGKTTLLKIIAGISSPTEGKLKVRGRIISLIGLEAGFHADLSGQENIFLNGLIIGMSKEEIKAKFVKIVDFAGIGDFITAPLYTYSNGMKLRLGFSIAIHAQPDILLLDEVMTMGDKDFQFKSAIAMKKMFDSGVTVLVVSQMKTYLRSYCNKIFNIER